MWITLTVNSYPFHHETRTVTQAMQNTLILGIGNTLLSDEGLGIHLLEKLRATHRTCPVSRYLDGGTLSFTLAPEIEDCENLIVLDAAQFNAAPGTIHLFTGEAMDHFIGHGRRSVHEVGLVDLLNIARLQDRLPANRALLGVQPAEFGWGESPSGSLQRCCRRRRRVLRLLYMWQVIAILS